MLHLRPSFEKGRNWVFLQNDWESFLEAGQVDSCLISRSLLKERWWSKSKSLSHIRFLMNQFSWHTLEKGLRAKGNAKSPIESNRDFPSYHKTRTNGKRHAPGMVWRASGQMKESRMTLQPSVHVVDKPGVLTVTSRVRPMDYFFVTSVIFDQTEMWTNCSF